MSDVYDADILAWSERQAALLRRRAAGELVNDGALDWPNIAEEIESVGRGELHACVSLLTQAMIHRLKVLAWPGCAAVPGWIEEELRFRQDASDRSGPSMRQRIDLPRAYVRARQRMPAAIDGLPAGPVPAACPWTLDELLDGDRGAWSPGGG